ncbi:acyl carrier protein [bacterium]|nr:acyl carrier protein [bacterium]
MSVEDRIRRIIKKRILKRGEDVEISDTQPLDRLGIESLAFLRMLTEVEKEFSLQIADDFWDQDSWNSISSLADYLRRNGAGD